MSSIKLSAAVVLKGLMAASALTVLSFAIPTPFVAFAQTPQDEPAPDEQVCMAGTTKRDGPRYGFTVLVPASRVEAMKARGFTLRDSCAPRQIPADRARNGICKVADAAREQDQERAIDDYGATLDELCEIALSMAPDPEQAVARYPKGEEVR